MSPDAGIVGPSTAPAARAGGGAGGALVATLAVALVAFCLAEVNYPQLGPQAQLAIFAGLGMVLAFLTAPLHPRFAGRLWSRLVDGVLALGSAAVAAYVVVQSEPAFRRWWLGGLSLGDRAGVEERLDVVVGAVGLLLVLEAARRTVGWALPILAVVFLAYARYGQAMPDWLFPHRGYDVPRVVAQTFLHSQGVYGIALRVMFVYVFLFVVLGAVLEASGATRFVVDWARRLFRGSAGAPAKVAVLASGLMGSLSGSAVANTATTGTFTIPLMRSAGFRPHVAAAIEAAASSGGALVPPVMGAGAYMMLELVDPPPTYLEIVRAAILPAVLFYLALFFIVHFQARKRGLGDPELAHRRRTGDPDGAVASTTAPEASSGAGTAGIPAGSSAPPGTATPAAPARWTGLVFFGSLGALLVFMAMGFTVFRAVSLALAAALLLAALHPATRLGPRRLLTAAVASARSSLPLVTAAASVGVVLGVVTLTGVGTRLPATLLPLADDSLFLALLLLMVSSIVLGMGLPSAVCYLLLATLVGPVLGDLGVVPLAAHFFIFYFGLMSMVTPPVALAAYTAASIAGSGILRTSFTAFRFSLIGFVLPFIFVYRPQLLMLAPDGGTAPLLHALLAFAVAACGVVPLAAAMTGCWQHPLGPLARLALFTAALALFTPVTWGVFGDLPISVLNVAGLLLAGAVAAVDRRRTGVAA